jgi:hypothetical protein
MLPTVDFAGHAVTRLILGDNPVNGYSYIPDQVTHQQMADYYTENQALSLLFDAQEAGINTFLPLAVEKEFRLLERYRDLGGTMQLIFQPSASAPLKENLAQMKPFAPIAVYHQGTTTDNLVEVGQIGTLKDRLAMIRDAGYPVGLGTHVPETVLRAEEESWGADFYMTCLYNARKPDRDHPGFIPPGPDRLVFYPEDREKMLEVVRRVVKPCLVFKLLAGGQALAALPPGEQPAALEAALRAAYAGMKPWDMAVIGAFQRDANQIGQSADLVKRILE